MSKKQKNIINGYFINIKSTTTLLGIIFLFLFPIRKLNEYETSYTNLLDNTISHNFLLFFISILLFIIPLSYFLYLVFIKIKNELYIKYINKDNVYTEENNNVNINNNKKTLFKKLISLIFIIIPLIFPFFAYNTFTRRNYYNIMDKITYMIKLLGSGYWLYLLCMIILVIIIFVEQTILLRANNYKNTKN